MEREEAIKRVPQKVDQILSDLDKKIQDGKLFSEQIQLALTQKLGVQDFKQEMNAKLDITTFDKWFPPQYQSEPKEYFKVMITSEMEWVQKSIMDMVKLWDQKLVKLRNDMNISNVVRRIGDKAEQTDVAEGF